jgi:hypothetical protein
VLAGRVPVLGSAAITQFTSYRLEYQRWIGGEWTTIREVTSLQPIQDGQLDEWDTAGLENGWYALQLTVRSSSGEEAQARTALTVSNPSR